MAKLWVLLRDKFFENIIIGISLILSIVGVIIWSYLSGILQNIFDIIPKDLLIAGILLLFVTCFIQVAYISYLRKEKKEDKFKDWEFIDKYGIWKNGETYYCASCKAKDRVSPMRVFETGWQCLVNDCQMILRNEKYVKPKLKKYTGGINKITYW